MPRKTSLKPGSRGVYAQYPEAVHRQLKELADRNGRSLEAELVHAAERHLAQPPKVTLGVQAEPLAEAEITPPRPRVGRPRKKKERS